MLRWNGDGARKYVFKQWQQRLQAACVYFANKVKEAISAPSPPVSEEGTPPHKDTGRLRASIAHEVDGNKGRVGTNLEYAEYLELGTSKMAPRPFLRATLDKEQGNINDILSGKGIAPSEGE